jgi:hypothetical protein
MCLKSKVERVSWFSLKTKVDSFPVWASKPNHDASLSSKTLITSAHVGGHDTIPTNTTVSSALEFALSSLAIASNEQYESIPDDEIALLVRKF